jgi:hypothetical protein
MEPLGDVGQVESLLSPFGDSVVLVQHRYKLMTRLKSKLRPYGDSANLDAR